MSLGERNDAVETSGNARRGSQSAAINSAHGARTSGSFGDEERRDVSEDRPAVLFHFDCRQQRTSEDSLEYAVMALDLKAKERGQTRLVLWCTAVLFWMLVYQSRKDSGRVDGDDSETQAPGGGGRGGGAPPEIRLYNNMGKVTLWRGLGIHASQDVCSLGNITSPL